MNGIKRISVFCGSSRGNDDIFEKQAFRLGEILASRKIGLVYGGTKIGLMNAVANGALSRGGEVTGVLPRFISDKGIAHDNLTELVLVDTMHERKTRMHELSDGIIALPGGFGTMEEFFEILTWGQLGLHRKPAGLLNIKGFYDPLMALASAMNANGFIRESSRRMLLISDNIDTLLNLMEEYTAPSFDKWNITKDLQT
ncbi:MAG TPA: TIGR00730 family Rossman fold protein [Bacteroidales bacterium]|nr:TIGR00730 family Rossman fold protein [Bacteroidales bacterium]